MTSPYSTNLLQQPVSGARSGGVATHAPRPAAAAPTRSVTHVVAAPAAMPAPQVVYVAAPGPGTRLASVALALLVLVLGAVAAVGGYAATRAASPDPAEAAYARGVAAREGFFAGNARGRSLGRQAGFESASVTANLRARLAGQRAWNSAFNRGQRAGERSYRRPSYGGSRRGVGYRGPRVSYPRMSETYAAVGTAQALANATGAPVDVEIY